MRSDFEGIIIKESLVDTSALEHVEILDTRVEPISPDHQTPWLTQWTLLTVRVLEAKAAAVAKALSATIDPAHPTSWYADFKNEAHHYVIYGGRVFHIDRRSPDQYAEAVAYGVSRGLPAHQADFVALIAG